VFIKPVAFTSGVRGSVYRTLDSFSRMQLASIVIKRLPMPIPYGPLSDYYPLAHGLLCDFCECHGGYDLDILEAQDGKVSCVPQGMIVFIMRLLGETGNLRESLLIKS
jgi:hypothetical protein